MKVEKIAKARHLHAKDLLQNTRFLIFRNKKGSWSENWKSNIVNFNKRSSENLRIIYYYACVMKKKKF